MGLKEGLRGIIMRFQGEFTLERLKKRGLTVGENFQIQPGYNLDPSHCWLITIGDNVTFAPRVQILAHDASMYGTLGYAKIARVTVGDRVFLGAGSIVLPGVTIGSDVIVGAGSVVTHDIPSGQVWAGNPAKQIGTTEAFRKKHMDSMKTAPCFDESYTVRKGISDEKKQEQKQALKNRAGYVI